MTDTRLAPQALDAERSLIGSLLIGSDAMPVIADLVNASDFYRKAHGDIYEAITSLWTEREPVDLTTVAERLREHGTYESSGGTAYLAQLMQDTPTAAHAKSYAEKVRDTAALRRLIEAAGKIAAIAYEEKDADDARNLAMATLLEAVGKTSDGVHIYSPLEQANIIVDLVEAMSSGQSPGIPTGLHNLDAVTGGLQRSELTVLAARPSVGKSALAENIAEHVARTGRTVAFCSIEMSKEMLLLRYLGRNGMISSRKFVQGLTPGEWDTLYALAQKRSELPIELIDAAAATSQTIRSTIDRIELTGKRVDLVVVDYLQLIANNEPGMKGESKADRIGRITGNLKAMARQFNVPVLLLSQLNRDGADGEPELHELRGSGDIEQDADVVLMLWREGVDVNGFPNVRMKVAKQRNGPIGDVPIRFDGPRYKFVDA